MKQISNYKNSLLDSYSFFYILVKKAWNLYNNGRLPLSPSIWINHLRRYYREYWGIQYSSIEYSSIIHSWQKQDPYQRWIRLNTLTPKLIVQMKKDAQKLKSTGAKISVIVPVYNPSEQFLREMIDSVRNQIYSNWELCIADDASTKPYVKEILQKVIVEDSRIKVIFKDKNGHIVSATNTALSIATGEYIALLDHDDILSQDALLHVAECIYKHPQADWIYTDEDKIDQFGNRFDPQMKGSWNPEMGLTYNFTHHLTVIRKALVGQLGGMRKGFEGAQDLDLFLRVSEKTTPDRIKHIPHVCYHWRTHSKSTASDGTQKKYIFDSASKAIQEAIQRRNLKAKPFLPKIAKQYGLCLYQLKWDNTLLASNSVTIIILIKDRVGDLEKCVSSLVKTVNEDYVKLLIVDYSFKEPSIQEYLENLQQLKILQCRVIKINQDNKQINFSQLLNLAVANVDTPYILHINSKVEAINSGWLEDMLGWISIDEVGVVGAKLLSSNKKIQHAGITIGFNDNLINYLFKGLHQDEVGYMCLPHAARNVYAVSNYCFLTSTELYRKLGGFDAENFAVQYYDVDYCLRVIQSGKRIVLTPQSTLILQSNELENQNEISNEKIIFNYKYKYFTDKLLSSNLNVRPAKITVKPDKFSHINRRLNLRLLFISHNLNLEGAPLIIYNYARYFAIECGWEVSVISTQEGVLRNEYEKLNISVEIYQDTLPKPAENIQGYRNRLKELGIKSGIEKFDLIICNTLIGFWGIELAQIFKLPTIWHIHESKTIENSIENFFGSSSKKVMEQLLRECLSNADKVIFQADATRKILHQFDIHEHFRTIPGGVDLDKINQYRNSHTKSKLRDKYKINQNHIVISIIGTTSQRKGQHIFIQAIQELRNICPDKFPNITCLIVGARRKTDLEIKYLNNLKNQINLLSLENILIYDETKDVYDFYCLSDIFVCASFEESFPRVLLEAMAFELNIVSTNVFGIPEIIKNGEEGFLVEPGNPKELAFKIYKYIQKPDLSEFIAKNAYTKVCQKFDNANLLAKHLSIAKEVAFHR